MPSAVTQRVIPRASALKRITAYESATPGWSVHDDLPSLSTTLETADASTCAFTPHLVDRSLKTAVAIGVPIAASLAIAVGAIGGASVLGGASHATLAAVLAFGAAALLYLVTEELLVEAHETPDTNWHVIAFFVGFIILFALEG